MAGPYSAESYLLAIIQHSLKQILAIFPLCRAINRSFLIEKDAEYQAQVAI